MKRKGDGQLLALKRIKVKNSNHKTKVWREAKLHAYLTENDVNYDHLIQYFDAWEETIDPEAIKQHDQPYIDKYNVEHKARFHKTKDGRFGPKCTSPLGPGSVCGTLNRNIQKFLKIAKWTQNQLQLIS